MRSRALAAVSAIILVSFISLMSRSAEALTSEEHSRISEAALRIACMTANLGENCDTPSEGISSEEARELSVLSRSGDPGHFSFADFVVYVDFIDDPEKLLHPALDGRPIVGSPQGETDLDTDFLWRLRQRGTAKLHAAHNNTSHFQEHLLHSLRSWHQAALDEAAATSERSLYAALIKVAIASHFLEDFFAPGHIVAPREAYSDYPANTLHDRHNARGRLTAVR